MSEMICSEFIMIKSFKCYETELIYNAEYSKKIPKEIQRRAFQKLILVDGAITLDDLRIPPANRLEKLSGNRKDQYSISINDQWRICFVWIEGHAYQVEIVDYH